MILEALEWRTLPYAGGVLDQPDALMGDLLALKAGLSKLREQRMNAPEGRGALDKE